MPQDPQHLEHTAHSLQALLATAAGLRRSNRELLTQLRALIGERHAQQARLLDHHLMLTSAPGDGHNGFERLRDRFGLTDRELEVAKLLAEGRRNTAIAAQRGVSPHTARHHTQHVLAKLGVHSRAEAGALLPH